MKGRGGRMQHKRYNRKKTFLKQITAIILLIILMVTISQIGLYVLKSEKMPFRSSFNLDVKEADTSLGWNLILVNNENKIPTNYEIELTELSNGKKVDKRIYPQLQKMMDAARSTGLELFVREGYRTTREQQKIMEEKMEEYRNDGYSSKEAKRMAKKYVAVPGTSEHQLGLSVDINADTSQCSSEAVYIWLEENAYKYGFIKRYPAEKTEITGVNDEPWHYRYVGEEDATKIQGSGLCLEEYIAQLMQ